MHIVRTSCMTTRFSYSRHPSKDSLYNIGWLVSVLFWVTSIPVALAAQQASSIHCASCKDIFLNNFCRHCTIIWCHDAIELCNFCKRHISIMYVCLTCTVSSSATSHCHFRSAQRQVFSHTSAAMITRLYCFSACSCASIFAISIFVISVFAISFCSDSVKHCETGWALPASSKGRKRCTADKDWLDWNTSTPACMTRQTMSEKVEVLFSRFWGQDCSLDATVRHIDRMETIAFRIFCVFPDLPLSLYFRCLLRRWLDMSRIESNDESESSSAL